MKDPRETNAAMNRFMREAREKGIGSPFRMNLYARARCQGKTEDQALQIARVSPTNPQKLPKGF